MVHFDDRILEPRPWTLLQATWAADLAKQVAPGPILELCAGAGHIGQAAARLTARALVQIDVDAHACEQAAANAALNGLDDVVEVRCGDLEEALRDDERFPVVLADPPYLPTSDVDDWPDDPSLAVDGGDDGLELPRRCLAVASLHVRPDGFILLQALGRAQVERLEDDIDAAGLTIAEVQALDARRAVALLVPNAVRGRVEGVSPPRPTPQ